MLPNAKRSGDDEGGIRICEVLCFVQFYELFNT